MYLIDTNLLSEASPTKDQSLSRADLVEWLDAASAVIWLSVVTVAEIEAGAERCAIKGEARKAARLREWLATVEHLYGERILPVDRRTAHIAGILTARARMAGAAPGFADAVIAATAQACELKLLTRNAKDFDPMGIDFLNPYADGLPPLAQ